MVRYTDLTLSLISVAIELTVDFLKLAIIGFLSISPTLSADERKNFCVHMPWVNKELFLIAAVCSASACDSGNTAGTSQMGGSSKAHVEGAPVTGTGTLPHSQGKSFETLDAYLSHRKKLGAQDRPYYERVGPDQYQLMIGRGSRGKPPQYFTRRQLLEKYGFSQ